MRLTLSFYHWILTLSSCFSTWPKSEDESLGWNKVKQKAFFIIFKGLSNAKNYLRPESLPLIRDHILSMLEKGRRFFVGSWNILGICWWAMKYKVFDGPQNIFLRSFFIILFFKLRGQSTKYKISKLAIKEI